MGVPTREENLRAFSHSIIRFLTPQQLLEGQDKTVFAWESSKSQDIPGRVSRDVQALRWGGSCSWPSIQKRQKAIARHSTALLGSNQHLLIHLQHLTPGNTCSSGPCTSDVVLETRIPASQGETETPTKASGRSPWPSLPTPFAKEGQFRGCFLSSPLLRYYVACVPSVQTGV